MPHLLTFMLLSVPLQAENPTELGKVRWQRDLDAALAQSKKSGKPVFALFQEIPGCSTCQNFGSGPLSQPLLVEAIETEFVPLAIYNNRKGKDSQVLKRFGEPSWNNPVVRFLGADGKDVIKRRDRVWKTGGIAKRMVDALSAASRPVPGYLDAVVQEHSERKEKTTFAMHCFWDGEARLGAMDGVIATRTGHVGGAEVVEVTFAPGRTGIGKLLKAARGQGCASRVFAQSKEQYEAAKAIIGDRARLLTTAIRPAKSSDQKFALRRSRYAKLDLTPFQQTKVNAALRLGKTPDKWLSPRQLAKIR